MPSRLEMACSRGLDCPQPRGGSGQPGTMSSRSMAASELRGNWANLQKFGVATVRRYPGTVLVRQPAVEHARAGVGRQEAVSPSKPARKLHCDHQHPIADRETTTTFPGDVHCGTNSNLFPATVINECDLAAISHHLVVGCPALRAWKTCDDGFHEPSRGSYGRSRVFVRPSRWSITEGLPQSEPRRSARPRNDPPPPGSTVQWPRALQGRHLQEQSAT